MNCENITSRSPLARRWHALRCPECRAAQMADLGLERGIESLRAEPAPAAGLARTLAALHAVPVADQPRGNRRKRAALRRWLRPTGMVTAAAAASFAGWTYYIDLDPHVSVPTPAMPAHNAFDLYRAAHAAEVDGADVDLALSNLPRKIKRSQIAPLGLAGTSGFNPPGAIAGAGNAKPVRFGTAAAPQKSGASALNVQPWTLATRAELVRKNERALRLLRQGLRLEYWNPPLRSPSTLLPYLSEDRSLARLLALEAQVRESRGDIAGAVNSHLDAMELGAQITRGSTTLGRTVGAACEAIGRKRIWELTGRLTARQAELAARRLQHIIELRAPYTDNLMEEEWYGVATIQEMFHTPQWRMRLGTIFGMNENDNGNDGSVAAVSMGIVHRWGVLEYLSLLPYSKRRILDNYMRSVESTIGEARFGYDAHGLREKEAAFQKSLASKDPITRIMCPAFMFARYYDVAGTETQDALLLTNLALRAYEQDHKGSQIPYPATLAALVPRYLAAVPVDPFGHGRPLCYRLVNTGGREGWHGLAYSVGPDGKDDGGKPIYNSLTPGQGGLSPGTVIYTSDNRVVIVGSGPQGGASSAEKEAMHLTITPDSTGDIIGGLNMNVSYGNWRPNL